MAYLTNSETDKKKMLSAIGVDSVEDIIKNIPQNLRFTGTLNLPRPLSEMEAKQLLQSLSDRNMTGISFLGGGVYDHYIPAIVDEISSRPEFYTSYTPYQPEVSQGNLQSMYEFQSMICELTGMDVTNASMYEAGSALAEAILLAVAHTGKKKVILPATINPRYLAVIKSYVVNMELEIVEPEPQDFGLDMDWLEKEWDDSVAVVVVQHPNYFGFLEQMDRLARIREGKSGLLIQVYDPISLGLLQPPAEFGVDIAVAEGQSLGNAQNFGGPFVGLFSTSQKLVRKIPGRLSGVTSDVNGKRGFVLTLQTREQHIRREKATSNICTNSGLMALRVAIYLAAMGKQGIREVADLSMQKAHYLVDWLTSLPDVVLASSRPFFKEFTLRLPVPAEKVVKKALDAGIFAGIPLTAVGLPDHLLIAVTEKRTRQELDQLVDVFSAALNDA